MNEKKKQGKSYNLGEIRLGRYLDDELRTMELEPMVFASQAEAEKWVRKDGVTGQIYTLVRVADFYHRREVVRVELHRSSSLVSPKKESAK